MKLEVDIEELRKRKLMVCTPMFGGNCVGHFARSIADLGVTCAREGITLGLHFLYNESLIPRARNYLVDEFMRSDFTHMMFIDADIGFNPNDVLAFLAMMSDDSPYDILVGAYPKKCISWEKIVDAVKLGYADNNPEDLSQFVGDYVFNPLNSGNFPIGEPVEILDGGTGFMMVRKNTFEAFGKSYPNQWYRPDHVRTKHFDGSREICAYFDCPIDAKRFNIENEIQEFMKKRPKATAKDILKFVKDAENSMFEYSKRYLSEDYAFTQMSRKIGMKIWLAPWVELTHFGNMAYGGSLKSISALGASMTADPSKLVK